MPFIVRVISSLYLPDHKSAFLPHILPAHGILGDVERPKCPSYLAEYTQNYLFINKLCVSNLLVIMNFYTIIGSTDDSGKQTQTPQHLHVLGLSMFRSFGFWTKNLSCSHMKSKRPLSFWTLLNGCFTSVHWIEDIGIFSLFSKVAFLKTGIIMIFHSGFVGLGCFSLEEKQTHRGIVHLPTNIQDTKSKVLARSGQQLPAAPAAIPPGPCPVHLLVTWNLTKDSPGMSDTIW